MENIVSISESLGDKGSEQITSTLLKNKMERDNIERGEQFKLSTGGNSLNVTVGTSDIKSKRKTVNQISFQTIMELSNVLELSENKTKKLCSTLRRNLGSCDAVELNIDKRMAALQASIDDFYECKTETFMEGDQLVTRDLVHVKDTSEFVKFIIAERGLDIENSLVRISLDGGQHFLKVIVNVFDVNYYNSSSDIFEDSGVKRCFILAIVEDVSEANGNLQKVLAPLNHEGCTLQFSI